MKNCSKNRVLVCGGSSFVAQGLTEVLERDGFLVDTFSRGSLRRTGNKISGSYLSIKDNHFLSTSYYAVVNYAVLKDDSVESNIKYIQSLIQLCINKGVQKLIHFSSVMVYNYHAGIIDESSPIESLDSTWKKGYGALKIAVDQYLLSVKKALPFELTIVRPGYVLAEGRSCPFILPLPLRFALIKGNTKSKQPIVNRQDIHYAVEFILKKDCNAPVYHFFPDNNLTKCDYAKQLGFSHLITMPKCIFLSIPRLLMKVGLMSKSLYSRFDGMFNECTFKSEKTEKLLLIDFSQVFPK